MTNNVNIPLLRKAVEWVEEQAALPMIDREWSQGGWVVSKPEDRAYLLAHEVQGGRWRDGEPIDTDTILLADRLEPYCGTTCCVAGYIGQMLEPRYAESSEVDDVHVSVFAARALGIAIPDDVHTVVPTLFNANNTAADVRRIAESLAGEAL